jgi:small subunit ribosomal protein S16
MLSIRMRRTGSKKRPYYRVVVTEGREPREGSFLEVLGTYNPRTKPAQVELDKERIQHWIKNGARPSDSVRTLLARHLTKDRGQAAQPVTAEATVLRPAQDEQNRGVAPEA